MLKNAIFFNTFLILVLSIVLVVWTFHKKYDLRRVGWLFLAFLVYAFFSLLLSGSEIVDIGWNFLFLGPASLLTMLLCIIGLIRFGLKRRGQVSGPALHPAVCLLMIVLPVLIFLIPYVYERITIGRCEYLLAYNYQNGIIQSDDSYIAIVGGKPVEVTLQFYPFHRKGEPAKCRYFNVVYREETRIEPPQYGEDRNATVTEDLRRAAADASLRAPSAKGASVYYFPEGQYAILTMMSEEYSGTLLGEYFYAGGEYVADVRTAGSYEEGTYYPPRH